MMKEDDLTIAVDAHISAKREVSLAQKHERTTQRELVEQLIRNNMEDCFTVNLERVVRRTNRMSPYELRERIHGDD